MSFFPTGDDGSVWYRIHGHGPRTVLFLHGLGCAGSRDFTPGMEYFPEERCTCVVLDLPGFGKSRAPRRWGYTLQEHAACVEALVDYLGIEEVDVVGHSLGGTLAALLLDRGALSIGRQVLIEPFFAHYPGKPYQQLRRTPAEREEEVFGQLVAEYRRRGEAGSETARIYAETLSQCGPQSYFGTMRSVADLVDQRDLRVLLRSRAPDICYVVGGANLEQRAAEMARLRDMGIEVRVIEDAGHDMLHAKPEAVYPVVVSFLLRDSAPEGWWR